MPDLLTGDAPSPQGHDPARCLHALRLGYPMTAAAVAMACLLAVALLALVAGMAGITTSGLFLLAGWAWLALAAITLVRQETKR